MGMKDPRVDAYIDKAPDFAKPILSHVRAEVHAACPEISETIKWGFPHFDYKDHIFFRMAAFKRHCAMGFWRGAELGIETRAEKAMVQFGRVMSLADLPRTSEFKRLLKSAMALHDGGDKAIGPTKARRTREREPELVVPAEFLGAIKQSAAAWTSFESFSPSQRREYVEWYIEAKTEATRARRLAQTVEWLAEGKRRNWKYER